MNNENNNSKEKTTFIKYGLASMVNEYNSINEYSKKKEYMDALASWYNHEKTVLAKIEDDARKNSSVEQYKNNNSIL